MWFRHRYNGRNVNLKTPLKYLPIYKLFCLTYIRGIHGCLGGPRVFAKIIRVLDM